MSCLCTNTTSPLRPLLLFGLAVLTAALLPLAGCDSSGSGGPDNGSDDGSDGSGALSAPASVTATAQSDGTVDLSWNGVDAAAAYNVYRSTGTIDDTGGSPLNGGLTSTNYTDASASEGTTYNYRVTSVSGDDAESGLSESATATTAAAPSDGETGGGGSGGTQSWTLVKTTTDNTINDVAVTANGAYAVADGGILLKRTDAEWTAVLQNGPSSNGNDLNGLAVTDDGDRLWFVGASGRIGEWNVTTGSLVKDHSAPNSVTNNFAAVTVTGNSGAANVQIAGKSGKVLYSTNNGGGWTQATPGSGSGLRALDTYGPQSGHVVDANQSVYETTDAGGTWTKSGIPDANVAFYGVDSDAADDVWVAGGNGTLYRWDGSTWMANDIGDPTLEDLEVAADDGSGFASGASGAVFAYDGSAWARQSTPTSENLNAVVLSTDSTPAIAVGAGGTVVER